jgi:small subunit ribosomal protein S27Ae
MGNKKNKDSQIFKLYKIEGDKIKRVKKDCPRFGNGVFMAEHKDRNTCGKCGFTEFTHRKQ